MSFEEPETSRNQNQQWRESGVLDGILWALCQDLLARGELGLDESFVDASQSTPFSTCRASLHRPPRRSEHGRCCSSHFTKGLTYSQCASVRSAMPFICFNFARKARDYSRATLMR